MSVYIDQLTRKRPLKGVHRGSVGEGWGEGAHVSEDKDKDKTVQQGDGRRAGWEGPSKTMKNYENVARKPASL